MTYIGILHSYCRVKMQFWVILKSTAILVTGRLIKRHAALKEMLAWKLLPWIQANNSSQRKALVIEQQRDSSAKVAKCH